MNLVIRHWTAPLRALDITRDLLTILVMTLMIAGEPLVAAKVRSTLGATYLQLGEYGSAEPHLKRALELRRKSG